MELDVRNTVCPRTTLVVRRCLMELQPADQLTVRGDYPPAERSIRRACYRRGFHVSGGPIGEREFVLTITVPDES
ncbi:sulfurtransferase TusA family protein [Halocatena halophila]|uniref:sulfurtransferase TusA family protein n=1 Tax=Halocatena halophila TaxID=2814576 RepID=UPI002ED4802E